VQDKKSQIGIEFYMPDVKWKEIKLSTKESFLVIVEQALKTKSRGMEFSITGDGKGQVSLFVNERMVPVVNISSGIFDRYWDFLTLASKAEFGLKIRKRGLDEIYDISIEPQELESGRKILFRFSSPLKESELLKHES
jgi:hypothetical protein